MTVGELCRFYYSLIYNTGVLIWSQSLFFHIKFFDASLTRRIEWDGPDPDVTVEFPIYISELKFGPTVATAAASQQHSCSGKSPGPPCTGTTYPGAGQQSGGLEAGSVDWVLNVGWTLIGG